MQFYARGVLPTSWTVAWAAAVVLVCASVAPVVADSKVIKRDAQLGGAMRALDSNDAYLFYGKGPDVVIVRRPREGTMPLHAVGRVTRLPGVVQAIDLQGHYAYVALGARGWVVLDVRAPEEPRVIATLPGGVEAWDLAVADSLLYVAAGREGVVLYDVASPARPRPIGVLSFEGAAHVRAVATVRDAIGLAVIEGADDLLATISVRDGRAALLGAAVLGERESSGYVDLAAVNGWCYVTLGHDLMLVDVKDPTAPRLHGERTDQYWGAVSITRETVLVGARADYYPPLWTTYGFSVGSLTDERVVGPKRTGPIGEIHVLGPDLYLTVPGQELWAAGTIVRTLGEVSDIAVSQDRMLTAGNWSGLGVVSVGDGLELEVVGRTDEPWGWGLDSFVSVAPGQDRPAANPRTAFTIRRPIEHRAYWLQALDMKQSGQPALIRGGHRLPGPFRLGPVADNVLYYLVPGPRRGGLVTLDLDRYSESSQPTGESDSLPGSTDVILHGNVAFVSGLGVAVVDVTNPEAMPRIGHWEAPGGDVIYDIVLQDDLLYAVTWGGTVYILDVSEPVAPQPIAELELPDPPTNSVGLELVGSTLLVGFGGVPYPHSQNSSRNNLHEPWSPEGRSGVFLVDVEDPDRPTVIGTYPVPGAIREIRALPNHEGAFAMAAGTGGVIVGHLAQGVPTATATLEAIPTRTPAPPTARPPAGTRALIPIAVNKQAVSEGLLRHRLPW